ncbi:MAG: hypothetical protein LUE16_08685 [Lachnospiraceae bacterium]|nr:hypothetical protein [Lachnospiraceae bacterium]
MLKKELYIKIEEGINKYCYLRSSDSLEFFTGTSAEAESTGDISSLSSGECVAAKIDRRVENAVTNRLQQQETQTTLYDLILHYIKRLGKSNFFFKNGEINAAAFYQYAQIDKSTWSQLKYGTATPKKETLLKLVIALQLSTDEAEKFMTKGSNSLNPNDPRDLVILALLDIKCYEIGDVYDVLEEYGKNGVRKFKNIYSDY